MKNVPSSRYRVAAFRCVTGAALLMLGVGNLAIADSQSFTMACQGRETDNSGRLTNPTAKPTTRTFSVQLSFELLPKDARVFVFDENRWIRLSEVSEYRLAFDWHSDFDNVASIDRYTNVYRFTKVTDKTQLRGGNDLIVTRMGKCHEIPYVLPPI
jgi:hypothetical protein